MKLTPRKRDGIYVLDRREEGLGRRSTGTTDFSEAQEVAADIIAERPTANAVCGYLVTHALDETWRTVWSRQKSALQKKSEVAICRRLWGELPVAAVTYMRILEDVDLMLAQGLKPSTINKRLSTLSRCLLTAVHLTKLEMVPKLPVQSVKNARERSLSEEQVAKLYEVVPLLDEPTQRPQGGGTARTENQGVIMSALITTLLHTGCRLSEILKARPNDVLEIDEGFPILDLPDTKNGQARAVPMTPEAHDAFIGVLWGTARDNWADVVTNCDTNDRALMKAREWCSKRFTRIRNTAKVPEATIHALRHTAATNMLNSPDADVYKVQQILGHTQIETTQRYARHRVEHLRGAVMALSGGSPQRPPEK